MALLSRLLVALILACATTVVSAEELSLPYPLDPADVLVPREKLSTQESDPFLFVGKVVDEDHTQWDYYHGALERHPTTLSCLPPNQAEKPIVNLLDFDWALPEDLVDLDVCLFRIFASLQDPELVGLWLASQDFQVIQFSDPPPPGEPYRETRSVFGFQANWNMDQYYQYRRTSPGFLKRLIGHELSNSFSYQVRYSGAGSLNHVRNAFMTE